jgi:hypothetical protein
MMQTDPGLSSWLSKALKKSNPIKIVQRVERAHIRYVGSRWKPLRGSLLVSREGGFARDAARDQANIDRVEDEKTETAIRASDAAAAKSYKIIAESKLRQAAAAAPVAKPASGSKWLYYILGAAVLGGALILFTRKKKGRRS